jgi:hypothetical protein
MVSWDVVRDSTRRRRLGTSGLTFGGTLFGYEPMTAGGLMSPEFVAMYSQATQTEALDRVRRAAVPRDALAWVSHHR